MIKIYVIFEYIKKHLNKMFTLGVKKKNITFKDYEANIIIIIIIVY